MQLTLILTLVCLVTQLLLGAGVQSQKTGMQDYACQPLSLWDYLTNHYTGDRSAAKANQVAQHERGVDQIR